MKRCPKCGTNYQDAECFCMKCGAELVAAEEKEHMSSPVQKKKSARWLVELFVGIILIGVTSFATLYVEHKIIPSIKERLISDAAEEEEKNVEETTAKGENDEMEKDADVNYEEEEDDGEYEQMPEETQITSTNLADIQLLTGSPCISQMERVVKDNVGNEYTDGYVVNNCEGVYLLNGEYETLSFDLAVDDSKKNMECVMSVEFYDENGNLLGKTGEFTKGVKPEEYNFSVKGVQELKVAAKFVKNGSYMPYHLLSHGMYLSSE